MDKLLNMLQWFVGVKPVKPQIKVTGWEFNVRFRSVRVKLNCLEASLICRFFDSCQLKNCRWWIRISQSYCFNISPFRMGHSDDQYKRMFKTVNLTWNASERLQYKPIWDRDLISNWLQYKPRSNISHPLRIFQRLYNFEELQVMEDPDPILRIFYEHFNDIVNDIVSNVPKAVPSDCCKHQRSNHYFNSFICNRCKKCTFNCLFELFKLNML